MIPGGRQLFVPSMLANSGLMVPNKKQSSGPVTPANGYVAEDGTTFYVAEDGVTFYVQEDAYIPAVASAAGYSTRLFFDDFTTNTVDLTGAHTGKNWYIDNAPYYPAVFCASFPGSICPASHPAWYTQSASVLSIAAPANSTEGDFTMSFAYLGGGSYTTQVPLIPGANGFYIEGRVKFLPPTAATPTPSLWMQDISGTLAQIAGAGAFRFPEIDILEGSNTDGAIQTYHDWSDWQTQTSQNTGAAYGGIDYTKWHTWGARVVPMALGGGTGSLTWYVDGAAKGAPVTWTATSQFGGVIESGMFQVNFASGITSPGAYDYIGVWVP